MPVIFPQKNSASDSVIALTDRLVYKIWVKTDYTAGLDYEQRVYARINNKILSQYPNAPFIKHEMDGVFRMSTSSAGVKKIQQTLDFPLNSSRQLHNKLLMLLDDFVDELDDYPSHISIGFNVTEICKDCKTMYDVIVNNPDESLIAFLYLEVCFGLNLLRQNKIAHNDLHHGNIFIDQTGQYPIPRIYDYDRSYIKGKNNPFLADGNLCRMASQCNSVNTYNRDMLYLLQWVFSSRIDQVKFLRYLSLSDDQIERVIDFYGRLNPFFTLRNGTDESILKDEGTMQESGIPQIFEKLENNNDLNRIVENLSESKEIDIPKQVLINSWKYMTSKEEYDNGFVIVVAPIEEKKSESWQQQFKNKIKGVLRYYNIISSNKKSANMNFGGVDVMKPTQFVTYNRDVVPQTEYESLMNKTRTIPKKSSKSRKPRLIHTDIDYVINWRTKTITFYA